MRSLKEVLAGDCLGHDLPLSRWRLMGAQCNYFLKRTVESRSTLLALLGREMGNFVRVLKEEAFQEDKEVLRVLTVFHVRTGGQESSYSYGKNNDEYVGVNQILHKLFVCPVSSFSFPPHFEFFPDYVFWLYLYTPYIFKSNSPLMMVMHLINLIMLSNI